MTFFLVMKLSFFLSSSQAMSRMNQQMNIGALQAMMMEFQKQVRWTLCGCMCSHLISWIVQSELMEMKQEVMDDTMDEVMGDADEEEETYVCECVSCLNRRQLTC